MNDVNEIRKAAGVGVQAYAEITEDGRVDAGDIGDVFDVITAAVPAVKDARNTFPQLAVSTNADMDASDQVFGQQLKAGSFSPETLRDLGKIENGFFAVLRSIARAKQEGIQEGLAQARAEYAETIRQLKAGEISTKDL